MNYSGIRCRVYEKTVLCEMPFIAYDLTFLYISFAKKFCQKKVKKNCKSVVRVSFENAGIRHGTICGDILSDEPEACIAAVTRIYRSR